MSKSLVVFHKSHFHSRIQLTHGRRLDTLRYRQVRKRFKLLLCHLLNSESVKFHLGTEICVFPVEVEAKQQTCPDGRQKCPDRYTCCAMTGGGYGCCPENGGVCCAGTSSPNPPKREITQCLIKMDNNLRFCRWGPLLSQGHDVQRGQRKL